jgi:hypothetical protein
LEIIVTSNHRRVDDIFGEIDRNWRGIFVVVNIVLASSVWRVAVHVEALRNWNLIDVAQVTVVNGVGLRWNLENGKINEIFQKTYMIKLI